METAMNYLPTFSFLWSILVPGLTLILRNERERHWELQWLLIDVSPTNSTFVLHANGRLLEIRCT